MIRRGGPLLANAGDPVHHVGLDVDWAEDQERKSTRGAMAMVGVGGEGLVAKAGDET